MIFGPSEIAAEMKYRMQTRTKIAGEMPQDTFFVLDPQDRMDSNVFYLTGVRFPGVALAFFKGKTNGDFYLFVPQTTPEQEVWTLPLPKRKDIVEKISSYSGSLKIMDKGMMEGIVARRGKGLKRGDRDVLENRIAEARMVKTWTEIERIRNAADATTSAFLDLMVQKRLEGRSEKSIRYLMDYFLIDGVTRMGDVGEAGHSFPTIVATPEHALCLHYDFSSEGSSMKSRPVTADDYIVIDAGARVDGYCSDVTRTIPISERSFKGYRKGLYEALRLAQERLVSAIKPGMTFGELNIMMAEKIFDALKTEGALTLRAQTDPAGAHTREMWKLMLHGIGHTVGIDVHDSVYYEKIEDLKSRRAKVTSGVHLYDPFRYVGGKVVVPPRGVITVEPGIYVTADSSVLKNSYRKCVGGMRIEDTVVVNYEGRNENLTGKIPKDISKMLSLKE